MKRFLLDTNILIELLRGNKTTIEALSRVGIANCVMSDISLFELLYGAECSTRRAASLQEVKAFAQNFDILSSSESFPLAAAEKARMRNEGTLIPDLDILIACTAAGNDCILVTNDTRHMSRIRNLQLQNWTQ